MNTKTDYKADILGRFQTDVLEDRLIREGEWVTTHFERALSDCESPIEAQLLLALFNHCYFDHMIMRWDYSKRFFGSALNHLEMCPQFALGPYRCDFAFRKTHPNGTLTRVIVECDGHDFHDRTKEQAQRDKSRDRYMQANGWRVLRFTGSEIYRAADKCADEIASLLENDCINDWRSANG